MGWARARGLFADSKGPWGQAPDSGQGEPPRRPSTGPWADTPGRTPGQASLGNVTSLDELLRRSRARFGGGGGGGFSGPNRSVFLWGAIALVLLWLVFTSMHRIAPEERGVVTTLGRYSRTLGPGIGLTLPSPLERVQKVDVENIRNVDLGSAGAETLMLTGDQNIIDIAYSVRWNIRDPEQYLFKLQNPDDTIQQVAESAMRAVVGTVTLNDAIGQRRGEIEARVQEVMQNVLDSYQAGVAVQGIAIKQADPPAAVNEAFKDVTAAQQEAESYQNSANAYSLQLRQKAQGEAGAFNRIYEQYRLAPEVTRRRMYYETMERVLSNVDKTIVEAPGVTPYLPLQQVNRGGTTSPAVQQGQQQAQQPSAGAGR
ncbi:FtsH protease activity modulator HflK [Sphingomonas sp. BN140010]|uniref:Protein HflK n=1 Tax=Sphingomonas arvum TaxID=2992113 RepID=A0ABT3JBK6_9SPHN|nr:FtsH protease activity modulator HflK [Sphingomonas sp. BN140010]MCW3796447.1 FtsH protease activity modulator HflK [Sphingomonas sp. BN140010]